MENSNRPVQRVIPIRSEFQNRSDCNINSQSSSYFGDTSCGASSQQLKFINTTNDFNFNKLTGTHEPIVPFVQQNVNIMNINLSNNTLLQGMSQDTGNSFGQISANPKTYLQLSDGRYVQIAQNIQPVQQQMPTTILVQMPFKMLDQSGKNFNQELMNKGFLLPSQMDDKSPQNTRFITVGNTVNPCGNLLASNQQAELYAKVDTQFKEVELQTQPLNDYQRHMKDQDSKLGQIVNVNGNIIALEKYQEICDMLQTKKLLTKLTSNEETVLVEFRLNQQRYQLRMTRAQKVDMERLLISAGNQQRQMEILQVYQSEQRKNMQQRTSVVLNQIINKNASNLVCTGPTNQTLNITKPIYPLNSVLIAAPSSQYNEASLFQSSNAIIQPQIMSNQSTVSFQNPSGVIVSTRMPVAQSSIMSVPSLSREPLLTKDLSKQRRVTKMPLSNAQYIPSLSSNQDMKPARSRRFNNIRKILLDDQNSVMAPHCEECFDDLNDVARRLLPYHILEESKDLRFDEVDNILSSSFIELTKKCTNLKRIASALTMHDMMNEKSDEQLLIKRMQLDLELDLFDREKRMKKENDLLTDDCNAVMVTEDSPVDLWDNNDGCEETMAPGLGARSLSFIESMTMEAENGSGEDAGTETMVDCLYNYDIQDISIDSLECVPVTEETDWTTTEHTYHPRMDIDDEEEQHRDNEHSADPDLDAAIKSISF